MSDALRGARVLGRMFALVRKHRGLTQRDAARLTGLHREVIGRIEHGIHFPTLETVERMCHVLRIPSREALGLLDAVNRKGSVWTTLNAFELHEKPIA